jgi:hypothetical protein
MSSWQVEVSRSMADWASSGSVMSGSHSGVAVGGDDDGGFAVPFGAVRGWRASAWRRSVSPLYESSSW